MIIDCKEIRNKEIEVIKKSYKGGCKVAFIQVGDNPASNVYVRNKITLCSEVGIEVDHLTYKNDEIGEQELVNLIKTLNDNSAIHGIMVQLPLPEYIREEVVINAIAPEKDIDGFTHLNKGKLMTGDTDAIISCTPAAVMDIINHLNIDVKGKHVVIAGRSNIVGKPLAQLLINNGATVTVMNSQTDKYLMAAQIWGADIFISAIGRANYFNKAFFDRYMDIEVKSMGLLAIDVGINRDEHGKLCGDIDKDLYDMFDDVTPVPGGVGIMTVLNVIKNSIKCYEIQK